MFKLFRQESTKELIPYVYDERKSVPYLYTNLKTYDHTNENIKVFVDESEGKLMGIALFYYDCLHFYTAEQDSYPVVRLLELIDELKPKVIMLQDKIGLSIKDTLGDGFLLERNYIIDMDGVAAKEGVEFRSELVGAEDIEKIVDLLLSEEEYAIVYDRDVLFNQMMDRYERGISRYVAVKEGDLVVATCSTYGEADDFALVGGVIVHKDWRRRGLAADVENYICEILRRDNKTRIGFVNFENGPSLALHKKLGAVECAIYSKFIRK